MRYQSRFGVVASPGSLTLMFTLMLEDDASVEMAPEISGLKCPTNRLPAYALYFSIQRRSIADSPRAITLTLGDAVGVEMEPEILRT